MEFITVTGIAEGERYIAIYRKCFNVQVAAWQLELVPGTLRWLNRADGVAQTEQKLLVQLEPKAA